MSLTNEVLRKPIHLQMTGRFGGLAETPHGVFGIDDMGNKNQFVFKLTEPTKEPSHYNHAVRRFAVGDETIWIEYDPLMVKSAQISQALMKI
jgi:hypothetical protein